MRGSYIFFDRDTAFQGEVSTDHLVLEGVINGDVLASKDVYLKEGSVVQGEISTEKFKIEEGSVHEGRIRMDLARERKEPSPEVLKSSENRTQQNGIASHTSHGNSQEQASSAFDSMYKIQESKVKEENEQPNNKDVDENNSPPQRLW
ncbi:MAG: polymer-forming cytoskeletal protein [Balneolaceae bacterium]|nr:polymer-forming cytoskeletal protein [Balneolaceae bacterium]